MNIYIESHFYVFNILSSNCIINTLTWRLTIKRNLTWSSTEPNMSKIVLKKTINLSIKLLHYFHICFFSTFIHHEIEKDSYNTQYLITKHLKCFYIKLKRWLWRWSMRRLIISEIMRILMNRRRYRFDCSIWTNYYSNTTS